MDNQQPKRRNVFIKKAFQGRFILGAFGVIVLSGLCSALLVYWLIGGDLLAQSQSAHVSIANIWERLGMSIMVGNLVAVVVAGGIAGVSVLYVSHKIAGPLHRFEALCEQIGDGNFDGVAELREKDQLQALSQAFSTMLDKLRDQHSQRSEVVAALYVQLSLLQNSTNLTAQEQEAVTAMTEALNRFDS